MLKSPPGPSRSRASWRRERAPKTVAAFERMLPFHSKIIHVRWSGESAWIPLGDLDIGLERKPENATSYPAPGQVLWYPGGISETELLFPYGGTHFASASSASSPATTSSRSSRASTSCARSANTYSGRARWTSRSSAHDRLLRSRARAGRARRRTATSGSPTSGRTRPGATCGPSSVVRASPAVAAGRLGRITTRTYVGSREAVVVLGRWKRLVARALRAAGRSVGWVPTRACGRRSGRPGRGSPST